MAYPIKIDTETKEGKLLIIAIHAMTVTTEIVLDGTVVYGTTKSFEEIYKILESINDKYPNRKHDVETNV